MRPRCWLARTACATEDVVAHEAGRPLETIFEHLLNQAGLTDAVTMVEHEDREINGRSYQAVQRL